MIIRANVKPGAKVESIQKVSENEYIISVKERAENGKANQELIKILAKELNVSQKAISIKNQASRKKIIEIN